MDIMTMSSAAVALALPFIGAVANGATEQLGAKAVDSGHQMLGWLRSRARGDTAAALASLEADPSNVGQRDILATALANQLQSEPPEAQEVLAILQRSTHVKITIDNRDGVFGNGEMTGVVGANASNVSISIGR